MVTEFAQGIPADRKIHPIPVIHKPVIWQFCIQEHRAKRAGLHYDLRLGDPTTKFAHSWALRNLPTSSHKPVLAIQQPTHSLQYMSWSGSIEQGYGAGEVRLLRFTKAEVLESDNDHIRFNLYDTQFPEEYLLLKTGHGWLLNNITVTKDNKRVKDLPTYKPSYKVKDIGKLDTSDENTVLQAKIDGGHNLVVFSETGSRVRVFSVRRSKRSEGGLIEHTHKIPNYSKYTTPKELSNSIIRCELYAVNDSGHAVSHSDVGGMLNSNVWKSRDKQDKLGKLRLAAIDVERFNGKDVSSLPFSEKREILKTVKKYAPWLELPESAETIQQKTNLIKKVVEGKHPVSKEGVVEWHLDKPYPVKAPIQNTIDVYVRKIFMEKSERNMAAGFEYSLEPNGPIIGKCGTGFSHALKKDMGTYPEKYIGLKAMVRAKPAPKHHALRTPAFEGWHLDQDLPEGIKMARFFTFKPRWMTGLGTSKNPVVLVQNLVDFVNSPKEGEELFKTFTVSGFSEKQVFAWISENPRRLFRWSKRLMFTNISEGPDGSMYRLNELSPNTVKWSPITVAWELGKLLTDPQSKLYTPESDKWVRKSLYTQLTQPMNLTAEELGLSDTLISKISKDPTLVGSSFEDCLLQVIRSFGVPMSAQVAAIAPSTSTAI